MRLPCDHGLDINSFPDVATRWTRKILFRSRQNPDSILRRMFCISNFRSVTIIARITTWNFQTALGQGGPDMSEHLLIPRTNAFTVETGPFFPIFQGAYSALSGPTLLYIANNVGSSVYKISTMFTGRSIGTLVGAILGGVTKRFAVSGFNEILFLGYMISRSVSWIRICVLYTIFLPYRVSSECFGRDWTGNSVDWKLRAFNSWCCRRWNHIWIPWCRSEQCPYVVLVSKTNLLNGSMMWQCYFTICFAIFLSHRETLFHPRFIICLGFTRVCHRRKM